MSSNFGEIIRKLYFLVWWKARQRATHATPHLSASCYRTFYTRWTAKCELEMRDLLRESLVGEGGVICETVPFVNGSSDQLLKTKIANIILLLHYLLAIYSRESLAGGGGGGGGAGVFAKRGHC